ncbi:MAG: GNAT family N-acetyltransferase [Anaerolineae bacterium]|nr:GNAT family N-acetyltransferase [Anaerolineae bacterium]
MSTPNFSLRQFTSADSRAYSHLISASPDTGMIQVAVHFETNPYEALMHMHPDTVGVVAESPGYDGLIGSGLIRFGQCQWEDTVRPYALINTLVVHPDFRRQGVASQLAKWRIDFARQRIGEDGLLFALIQTGNTGSELTAKKWYTQFVPNRLAVLPVRMRTSPPKNQPQYHVRHIKPNEFEAVAALQNNYYQDYNLYPPETGEDLAAWCSQTQNGKTFHHYVVVTDKEDNILAGLGLADMSRLRTISITNVPPFMKILDKFLHVFPESDKIVEILLSRFWFTPGHQRAAKYLFETVRWQWKDNATTLLAFYDKRNPIADVYALRPWHPSSQSSLALQSLTQMPSDRLVYYA